MLPGDGGHPREEIIERYSMGKLSGPELETLEEHLMWCAECRERIGGADEYIAAVRGAINEPRLRHPWFPRLRWIPLWVAAACALMVAVVLPRTVAPVPVALVATRGVPGTDAPAGRPLTLKPDLAGVPVYDSYRLEVVDASGRQVWNSTITRRATARLPKQPGGSYFVRIYSPAGELLREYGLRTH